PVESLTCEACGTETVTRDLPPVGIDVAAALEELAAGQPPSLSPGAPTCACGARVLSLTIVLLLVVHTAGASMTGEVSPARAWTTGTLSCAGCSGCWTVADPGLPPEIGAAIAAFTT